MKKGCSMSFSKEEIEEFKSEALELLEVAEKSLLDFDKGNDFKTTFDNVFRCFHNLKGSAGMMEMAELQTHTHELENKLMQFKDSDCFPKETVSHFLRGIDEARRLIEVGSKVQDAEEKTPECAASVSPSDVIPAPETSAPINEEFMAECGEIVERVSAALQLVENGKYTKATIDSLYRDIHSLKGAAYLFSYQNVGDLAHIMESSLEPIRDGTHLPSENLVTALHKCLTSIELEVCCLKKNMQYAQIKTLIVTLTKLLQEATLNLQPVVAKPSLNSSQTVPQTFQKEASTVESVKVKSASALESSLATPQVSTAESIKENEAVTSIRVSVPVLDNLMTLMGEMVLVRNQVLQFANLSEDLSFVNLSKRLNLVTSEIQGELMKTRMQPMGNVINKFTRVVRDLSQDLGKKINLSLQGVETELDKSLLEAIKDPLTHIVRNSCDHGIEGPDVRRQSGKPECGNISIKSFHEGGQVVIEVADDGKGLSCEMLVRKGIEKGLITAEQSKLMNEKEIFGLIFSPGFSTAAKVTNVSGRGVGMDVVRTNIERIGGTIELLSQEGRGTKIRIKIPLTLAIVPALIVRSGKNIFAIPQVKLVELVRIDQSSESKIEFLQGTPVCRLRGNILPLVDLNQIFQNKLENKNPTVANIVILNAEHGTFGLIVEEIHDTADIVVKPLNGLLKSLQIYSGATVLGDGSVALILDVLGISKVAQVCKDETRNKKVENNDGKKISLETQDYILVQTHSPTKHAIVLGYVHRLEEFKTSDIEMAGGARVIRYRNEILQLISVDKHFGYNESSAVTESQSISVVVVVRAGKMYGIQVEKILDTLSTDITISPDMGQQTGIFGHLNMKDELIVVIDPFELIDQAFPHSKPKIAQDMKPIGLSVAKKNRNAIQILLAEDTPFFRKAVAQVLEQAGYSVMVANDGQEAFDILSNSKNPFDLVISDIEMPRMNGFELAAAVRKSSFATSMPMLAVSSKADKKYVQKGLDAGFNVYLEKLKPDLLLQAVGNLIEGEKSSA